MLRILLICIIVLGGIALGPSLIGHQGYVLIQTDQYTIETSITALTILVIISMTLLLFAYALGKRLWRTGTRAHFWWHNRHRIQAKKSLELGLLKWLEQDYAAAEQHFAAHANHSQHPHINYLLASAAAEQQGRRTQALTYLNNTTTLNAPSLAQQLAHYRLMADQDNHADTAEITQLLKEHPKHPGVITLAYRYFLKIGDNAAVLNLLPTIKQLQIIPTDETNQVAQQIYHQQLEHAIREHREMNTLFAWWQQQPKTVTAIPSLQIRLLTVLVHNGAMTIAEQMVIPLLKNTTAPPELLALFPNIRLSRPKKIAKLLTDYQKHHGTSRLLTQAQEVITQQQRQRR